MSKRSLSISQLYQKLASSNLIHTAELQLCPSGFSFGPHCHNNVEVLVALEGNSHIKTDKQELMLASPHYVVLFSNTKHLFCVEEPGSFTFFHMHFHPELFTYILQDELGSKPNTDVVKFTTSPFLLRCVNSITCEAAKKEVHHDAMINILLCEIAITIARDYEAYIQESSLNLSAPLQTALSYIQQHYQEKISLDALSEACYLSKTSLCTLFRNELGTSVLDYIYHIKMDKAIEMIKEGFSSAKISEQLGFSNVQYFSKMFKKKVGCSFRDYLKK